MELADPEMLGFDASRLARIGVWLDATYIDTGRLPGVDVLVARDGEAVYRHTAGASRADGTPMTGDAIFRIASMTKPLTSVAFMMLVEEGKVALDDPVTKVVPEFAGLGVYTGGGGEVD
ncbi:MAG: serine hydrolase domain-containing protein, partial [Novosphingobium sp.]